jgi:hypothetical protein
LRHPDSQGVELVSPYFTIQQLVHLNTAPAWGFSNTPKDIKPISNTIAPNIDIDFFHTIYFKGSLPLMAFQNIAPFLTSVWGKWAFENSIHFT